MSPAYAPPGRDVVDECLADLTLFRFGIITLAELERRSAALAFLVVHSRDRQPDLYEGGPHADIV